MDRATDTYTYITSTTIINWLIDASKTQNKHQLCVAENQKIFLISLFLVHNVYQQQRGMNIYAKKRQNKKLKRKTKLIKVLFFSSRFFYHPSQNNT